MSSLEKEKATMKAQMSAPPSTPNTPQSHLTPKQLSFAMPQEKTDLKKVINSPTSSVTSDVSSYPLRQSHQILQSWHWVEEEDDQERL